MLLSLLLLCSKGVIGGGENRIRTPSDFVAFANNVNSGTSYSGTTVYVESDLSLSGHTVNPVGLSSGYYFLGTFDGQGHVISDLEMNSSSACTGLFGFSTGLTVKNVVLDDTCSITNSYTGSSSDASVGGILGYCESYNGPCSAESSVSMADVTFIGKASSTHVMYIGGIIGSLCFNTHAAYLENCANYGSLAHSGESKSAYIGGILGLIFKAEGPRDHIRNSLNYGSISCSKSLSRVSYVGGIIGFGEYIEIENCVSAGKMERSGSGNMYIGSIAGYVDTSVGMVRCFWTSDIGSDKACGKGELEVENEISLVELSSEFVADLNGYALNKSWCGWLLNMNNESVSFAINNGKGIVTNSQIVLFPNPLNNSERTFSGWYSDETLTRPFTLDEVETDTTLYGMFCGSSGYTVTLDTNGGDELGENEKSVIAKCNGTYGALPKCATKTGCTFNGWFTEKEGGNKIEPGDKVTEFNNHTLYAQWTTNSYILTFDLGDGRIIGYVLTYGERVTHPENVTRDGYVFVGWNGTVTKMPAEDLVITALWVKLSAEKGASPPVVIGVSIFVCVVIVALAFLVIFMFLRNRNKVVNSDKKIELERPLVKKVNPVDRYYRSVTSTKDEIDTKDAMRNVTTKSILTNLYPRSYTRPTMRDALLKAKLTEEQTDLICARCEEVAKAKATENGLLFDGFTEEDAAAIAMYTYEFGGKEFENNPYRIINRGLVEKKLDKLRDMDGLLYLVMTALRKLPRVTGITLYRGVRGEVNMDENHYCKGNVVTWPALSSTSPNMEETKKFLAKGTKKKKKNNNKAKGTLFIIENAWGYDIQPYSLFPDEAEILIEPERWFMVDSVIQGEGLTFIKLRMVDAPLSLPQVFGEGEE